MQNQPSLKEYYERIFEQTKNDLLQHYGNTISVCRDENAKKSYTLTLLLSYRISGNRVNFLICFPRYFPDYFPDIFLKLQEGQLIPFPHIDKRGFVCTVDKETSSPNTKDPTELAITLIDKAIGIYRAGLDGRNAADFRDEFLAYWIQEAHPMAKIQSMFSPGDTPKTLFYVYKKTGNELEGYVFESRQDFRDSNIIQNLKIEEFKEREILYIPLNDYDLHPFSSKIRKIVKAIKANKFKNINKAIDNTYQLCDEHPLFLSSIYHNDSFVVFGWEPRYSANIKLPGFRARKLSFFLAVLFAQGMRAFVKYNIERTDKQRLFGRVGEQLDQSHESKLLIAGCGSIGSHLAMGLAKAGFSKFALVDNDCLSLENIARHLCGFSFVNSKKVKAVQNFLYSHFPYLECSIYDNDILDLISENAAVPGDVNLNIIAIGKTQVELRCDQFTNQDCLYIWVEPFGVAGHAIYIPSNANVQLSTFYTKSLEYKLQVITNSLDFYKRESGCQSTFVPYSFTQIEIFVSVVIGEIIEILRKPDSSPKALVWIGALKAFKNKGIKINNRFLDKEMQLIEFTGTQLKEILSGDII